MCRPSSHLFQTLLPAAMTTIQWRTWKVPVTPPAGTDMEALEALELELREAILEKKVQALAKVVLTEAERRSSSFSQFALQMASWRGRHDRNDLGGCRAYRSPLH